jgi:hypothetical protein
MPIEVAIRRPRPHEYDSVRDLTEIVATETFKDLFAPNPVPLEFKDEDWPLAWVAASDAKILGVIITHQECRAVARRAAFASLSRIWSPYSSILVKDGGLRVSSPTKVPSSYAGDGQVFSVPATGLMSQFPVTAFRDLASNS